jgi:predicted metalloprotease
MGSGSRRATRRSVAPLCRLAPALALQLVVSACSDSAPSTVEGTRETVPVTTPTSSTSQPPAPEPEATERPTSVASTERPTSVPSTEPPTSVTSIDDDINDDINDDAVIVRAAIEVDEYWSRRFAELYPGEAYTPLDPTHLHPYGSNDPPPTCGGTGLADYASLKGNAFYCPAGDFVAWDTDALTPGLLSEFGALTLAVVVAHELGHRVQALHGILDGRFATFVTEQQADCFAGAWTSHAAEGGSESFDVTQDDLDRALAGFLKIRDPVGTNTLRDPRAHGSAFQRVNAFEDGFVEDASKCKTYEDGALQDQFVPETFDDVRDLANEGNLPLNEIEPLVIANLDAFWSHGMDHLGGQWTTATINAFDPDDGVSCGDVRLEGDDARGLHFYCPLDDTMNWDAVELMPTVYREIGDMAVAVIIASQFSQRAQRLLDQPTGSLEANLQTDCFTGAWAGVTERGELDAMLPADSKLSLSPGDLDEALAGFIAFAQQRAIEDESGIVERGDTGSAFQRVGAFRSGFYDAFNDGLTVALDNCIGGAGAVAGLSHDTLPT